jgi:hypothetical protein
LQILGRHDRPRIEKLDHLLGGVILGAGVAAGAAVLLGPALAPLGAFAAIWGWLEQKNEAIGLLRKVLDAVSDRSLGIAGYERYRLVAAAHTAIVAAALFEVLREQLGEESYKSLAITEKDRKALALGQDVINRNLIELLYETPVPAPSPARGFEETIPYVRTWMSDLAGSTQEFLNGLASWQAVSRPLTGAFVDAAVERYRSHYLSMAATVPEFLVWASLGEHAATRNGVTQVHADVLAALEGQSSGLARLETMLNLVAARVEAERDICSVVRRSNRGVLEELIIPEAAGTEAGVTFPAVGRIFLNPRYRLGWIGEGARPADETWWQDREVRTDLDLLLVGQVTAPDAAHAPLLLLGHPGAGKSLLTKVIAARLPASAFTVVRVPLRRVDAGAPIYEQIQQALDAATHGRVDWWELADRSSATVRVVLLDGLDELLQAAGHRGGYLQEVVDFQRREAEQDRPVVVVVTSRTVVADRVTIPLGTTVLRLEGFDEVQIEAWLGVWNEVNAHAIASGAIRGLRPGTALRQPDLASQPLLLMMLAIYSADPKSPAVDSDSSSADLYRRLLDNFIRREVAKSPVAPRPDDFEEAVRGQFWRLSIAALAMFNRGRQDVTNIELGGDLSALEDNGPPPVHAAELGEQLIGQFFFVYSAEAKQYHSADARRCYEFLHATFGEYLLASYVVEMLSDIADTMLTVRRGAREPDDDLLYALLSHQPLAVRKTTLTFAAQLVGEFQMERRTRILSLLETLTANYRRRYSSDRYVGYRPMPVDRVRQLSAYSANLILLRIMLDYDGEGLPLSRVCSSGDDSMLFWRSTVALWRSGLDPDGFQAILSTLAYDSEIIRPMRDEDRMPAEWVDLLQARLVGDRQAESRLRFGMAIRDKSVYSHRGDRWDEVILSGLIPAVSLPHQGAGPFNIILPQYPENSNDDDFFQNAQGEGESILDVSGIQDMVIRLLILKSHLLSAESVQLVVNWILNHPTYEYSKNYRTSYGLASAVAAHPRLLDAIPELNNPDLYSFGVPLIFMLSPQCDDDRLRSLHERIKSNTAPSSGEKGKDANRICLTTELLDMMRMVLAAHQIESIQGDTVLLHLAALAGRTVVDATANDAWEAAKRGVARLLGRDDPRRERATEMRLDQTHERLAGLSGPGLEANRDGQADMWEARFADLLDEHPDTADDLRALIYQIQAEI